MSETSEAAIRAKFTPPLPVAVQRQKVEIENLMRGAPEGVVSNDAPPAPVGGQGEAGPGPAPVDAGGAGVQPTPDGAQQVEPPASAKAETKADSGDSVESLKRALRDAEQEARTWKGRHSKTAEEQRALESRIADLEARLREASQPPEPEFKDVAADEVEAYGQDLLEVSKRYTMVEVRAAIERALRPLLERLDALDQGVGHVQAKEAKTEWEAFKDRLSTRLPGWQKIDESEGFLKWLDEEDEVFGEPNRKALVNAAAALNVERAAKVYERFLDQTEESAGRSRGTKAAGTPAAGTESGANPTTAQSSQDDPRPTLEDLAAPGRPNSAQPALPTVPPGVRIWTQPEIDAYYRGRQQRSHPHYLDRAAAMAMDAEIAAAGREGRIR